MEINSNKIRLLISQKKMTQTEFAEKSGISRAWLSNVLNRGRANASIINKIAHGLDLEPNELLINDD